MKYRLFPKSVGGQEKAIASLLSLIPTVIYEEFLARGGKVVTWQCQ